MIKHPKISVITPSYNAEKYIECAIKSVLKQNYANFEHVIIDGDSSDGTVEVLKRFSHLIWLSEPDRGQSDAMNKGFKLSDGQIVVYLNADDYFEKGAFQAVLRIFNNDSKFVVGKIRVIRDDGSYWINNPKIGFREILKWWQKDAFCFNPAGYFYLREVQEVVGEFDINNNNTMDLDFLLHCARRFEFVKIDQILGNFRLIKGTKTANSVVADHYAKKISICDKHSKYLEGKDYDQYLEERLISFRYLKSRIAVEQGIKDLKVNYEKHRWLLLIYAIISVIRGIPLYLIMLIRRLY